MSNESEIITVTPELRGRIVQTWNSPEIKALVQSIRLRHDLVMREVLKQCREARQGILQEGVDGIPKALNKQLREAATLLLAIETFEREVREENIILRLI